MEKIIKSQRLGEEYKLINHSSGLTILLYPMKGYSTAYALFTTKYGSVDTTFKTQDEDDFLTVPEGIAHFLEHKLFESEDGDAFDLYAKTGASANAYTSFDKTAYLFSCSDNFRASIEILLGFVTDPYFTQATVDKEMGIIGQEIRMYEDNADWRVFFNLLGALYHNHPVKIDIAGTAESISRIDAELLHRCYRTFYNLNNMVLTVAGNFDPKDVLEAADKILEKAQPVKIERGKVDEPENVFKKRVEQVLPVAIPLFQIGFKGSVGSEKDNLYGQIIDELISEIVAGEASPLYSRLYKEGLINQTFDTSAMSGRDYSVSVFEGESRNPDKVYEEICKEINRITEQGIDEEMFLSCKKAAYGRYMGVFGKAESVTGILTTCYLAGELDCYNVLEKVANLTLEEVNARLKSNFNTEKSAISIIKGS